MLCGKLVLLVLYKRKSGTVDMELGQTNEDGRQLEQMKLMFGTVEILSVLLSWCMVCNLLLCMLEPSHEFFLLIITYFVGFV